MPSTPAERRASMVRLVEGSTLRRVSPPLLLPADLYLDLAGEEFSRNLLLTTTANGVDYCLRPDFTLPIAKNYLDDPDAGTPAAYAYWGTIFRQENGVPYEDAQAGLELLGEADPDAALDRVLSFAHAALGIYHVERPSIRLGGIGLFEALIAELGLPPQWRSRIRHRFGRPEALGRLLERMEMPEPRGDAAPQRGRDELIEAITDDMRAAGLSLQGSRHPDEIADRFLEKQALDRSPIDGTRVRLLRDYLAISGPVGPTLDQVATLLTGAGIDLVEPIARIRHHAEVLSAQWDATVVFDAGFSPRLDFYTGIAFEIVGDGETVLVSGGQYDRLLGRLGATTHVAASGCAVWTDRLEREAML